MAKAIAFNVNFIVVFNKRSHFSELSFMIYYLQWYFFCKHLRIKFSSVDGKFYNVVLTFVVTGADNG